MTNLVCPLSGDSKVVLLNKLQVGDLIKMYKRQLKIDIAVEFRGLEEIGFYHCLESDLRFFYPAVTGSEFFYEMLQKSDLYYMDDKPEYEYARTFIKESDFVLEIGSGKGSFLKTLSTNKYVGLEFSREAKNKASKLGVELINESIQCHAINNYNKYDVVCAFQVLEHVAEVYSFIESSILCLKPGGFLIYSVPSQDSFSRHISNLILDLPPHHVTRWSDNALKNIARYFPLDTIEIWHEPLQPIHNNLYAQTILTNSILTRLNRSIKTIDLSFTYKTINLLSKGLGRLFAKGLTSYELIPRGISVTIVYRKRAA